jgi:uncharacterized membrane protein
VHILVIVLRVIHILSGVFWVGSAIFTGFFVSPAVAATAEAGQKFMAHLVTKSRVTARITAAAILTVLAGAALYWIDSQGLTSLWTTSGPGIGFGLGALFAIVGLVFGVLVGKSTAVLGRLAAEISSKPTPDQMEKLGAARRQLAYAGPASSIALILALACMATARYWLF